MHGLYLLIRRPQVAPTERDVEGAVPYNDMVRADDIRPYKNYSIYYNKEIYYMLYSEKVLDHFSNPRNVGEIENADGIGEVGNAKCGDIMKMYIKVDNGIITDVKFKTFGCGAAVATSSMATELIKGKSIDDALKLTNKAVVEALDGLPAVKLHCSVLAEQAIKSALSDYYTRQGIDPLPIVGEIGECEHCH